MPKRTVVQPGEGAPTDLIVYCHIDPSIIAPRVKEVTADAVLTELWGEGTNAYKAVIPAYGGSWDAFRAGVSTKLDKQIGRSCLTTWSAGSQVAKDVCRSLLDSGQLGGEAPYSGKLDALVMLDGMYGDKPAGSKPGDGKIVLDQSLRALFVYALAAAKGECVMVVLHSAIPTPYASSAECAKALQAYVEGELGVQMTPDKDLTPEDMNGHGFTEALVLGDLHVIAFPGVDAKEHVTEAHLFDEVWRRWVPWTSRTDNPVRVAPDPTPAAETSVAGLALKLSLDEQEAGVGEEPPGSNKVKPVYWAGCSRIGAGGVEAPLKMSVGPWCAAAFQWASYEAARQLGITHPEQLAAWRLGDFPVPHGHRVSVAELQADMTARGLFRPASVVRSGAYKPAPGDAVFLDRPGGPGAGWGHVCRFVRDNGDGSFETVGGNESGPGGDKWRRTTRRYTDALLRGFGCFDIAQGKPAAPKALRADVVQSLGAQAMEWAGRPRPDAEEQG